MTQTRILTPADAAQQREALTSALSATDEALALMQHVVALEPGDTQRYVHRLIVLNLYTAKRQLNTTLKQHRKEYPCPPPQK